MDSALQWGGPAFHRWQRRRGVRLDGHGQSHQFAGPAGHDARLTAGSGGGRRDVLDLRRHGAWSWPDQIDSLPAESAERSLRRSSRADEFTGATFRLNPRGRQRTPRTQSLRQPAVGFSLVDVGCSGLRTATRQGDSGEPAVVVLARRVRLHRTGSSTFEVVGHACPGSLVAGQSRAGIHHRRERCDAG